MKKEQKVQNKHVSQHSSNEMLGEVFLSDGETKIVRALQRLEKLWVKHGENLLLFNGQSLRYKGQDHSSEIDFFGGIKGDGGDGGDNFA